LQNPLS